MENGEIWIQNTVSEDIIIKALSKLCNIPQEEIKLISYAHNFSGSEFNCEMLIQSYKALTGDFLISLRFLHSNPTRDYSYDECLSFSKDLSKLINQKILMWGNYKEEYHQYELILTQGTIEKEVFAVWPQEYCDKGLTLS